ncbi:MAG: ABC transporter ATP-binding protein [Methanomassiliicoccales archaeon]|nr:MAG: ABC transporter ATP-binding protein [Methanomassiliicoccales archaeon]
MTSIVSAKNVYKTYDTGKIQVKALKGVDIEIAQGEMVAVMGPSGCGKTTLLNCLSGLDDLSEGQVLIEGQDVHAMKDNKRTDYRAEKMGFIFQNFNLLPVLTAAENVELPLLVSGTRSKVAREKAISALGLVGMEDWKDHKPSELSGGQQQRVTIARSLVNNPTIVWGDEPTGNLDSENSTEVMELLVRLNRENKQTFVVVTHDPAVGKMCGRLVEMRNGLIVRETTT